MPKHNIMISADVPGVDDGLRSFLRRVIALRGQCADHQ